MPSLASCATNATASRARSSAFRSSAPRRIDVLIELINDDAVAEHAMSAVRQCGYRGGGWAGPQRTSPGRSPRARDLAGRGRWAM